MSEHDWEKLFVIRVKPGLSPGMDLVYADLDKCSQCGALRRIMEDAIIYKSEDWSYNTTTEPPCGEE